MGVAFALSMIALAAAPPPVIGARYYLGIVSSPGHTITDAEYRLSVRCTNHFVTALTERAAEGNALALPLTGSSRYSMEVVAAAVNACFSAAGIEGLQAVAKSAPSHSTTPSAATSAGPGIPSPHPGVSTTGDTPSAQNGLVSGQSVVAEINRVRANPEEYSQELKAYELRFHGNVVYEPGDPVGHLTKEGTAAVEEAASFVASQLPHQALTWSTLLAAAARDHAVEQAPTDITGHIGADGSTVADRVQRRGGGDMVGEIIAYGNTSAAAVVRQLIVDDGVSSRGHRTSIFDDQYAFAGGACGPHHAYRYMCVVDLAMTRDAN